MGYTGGSTPPLPESKAMPSYLGTRTLTKDLIYVAFWIGAICAMFYLLLVVAAVAIVVGLVRLVWYAFKPSENTAKVEPPAWPVLIQRIQPTPK